MMKLPNGYGSITKLSGARRRPFVIREGQSGKQKIIGYAATKEEAIEILAKYNGQPWDTDKRMTTMAELFDLWQSTDAKRYSVNLLRNLTSVYRCHCSQVQDVPYRNISQLQMQNIIDTCGCRESVQSSIKNLFCHLDRLALADSIISVGHAQNLLITTSGTLKEKTIFADEEVDKLWAHQHESVIYQAALIYLYSGWRCMELLSMKIDDVSIEKRVMKGGMKTKAGKNRVVPIHHKILPVIEDLIASSTCELLIPENGHIYNSGNFRHRWYRDLGSIGINHSIHECRHTYRTWLAETGASTLFIDKILGHSSGSVGDQVYTHLSSEKLAEVVEKVTH